MDFLSRFSPNRNNGRKKKNPGYYYQVPSSSSSSSSCLKLETFFNSQARNGLKVGDVTPELLGAGPQAPTGAGWRTDEGCCWSCGAAMGCKVAGLAVPKTPKFCWWRSSLMLGRGAGWGWNGFGWPAAAPEPLKANGLAAGTGLGFVGTCDKKKKRRSKSIALLTFSSSPSHVTSQRLDSTS